MTRILLTGANGQVGRELQRAEWSAGTELTAFGSSDLDITKPGDVADRVAATSPDVIVNAAAYTGVDTAEDEPELAHAVNATAVGYLAEAANRHGAALVHLSTDYVFDGSKTDWYDESDPTCPIGVYGKSKAAGEEAADLAERSAVLRTAWVYGALGSNFVTTMLRLAGERDELGVVDDQYGCPTSAADIATAVVTIAEALSSPSPPRHRLYHVCSSTDATWHQFAMAIFEASTVGFDGVCRKLTTPEYPTKATRPANSRLRSSRLAEEFGLVLPAWQIALPPVVAELEQGTTSS